MLFDPHFNLLELLLLIGACSLGWYLLYRNNRAEIEQIKAALAAEVARRQGMEAWLEHNTAYEYPNEDAR